MCSGYDEWNEQLGNEISEPPKVAMAAKRNRQTWTIIWLIVSGASDMPDSCGYGEVDPIGWTTFGACSASAMRRSLAERSLPGPGAVLFHSRLVRPCSNVVVVHALPGQKNR